MTFLRRYCILTALTFASILCFQQTALPATPEKSASPNSTDVTKVDPLIKQVDEAIETSVRRYLDANVHTPWQIIHGILALRHDYELKLNGERVSALGWIANDPVFRGEHWFEKTPTGGRAHPYSQAYAFEGHANQFLAYLTMSDLPREHQFKTANGIITIDDMVRHAQATTSNRDEPTWTLWALAHYLTPDSQWTNQQGEAWSIEKLVQLQTKASVYSAACGGTHGLFALSYARNSYIHSGQPLRGVWLEADQKIRRYIQEARTLQNSDGMFSASYFQGRKSANDFEGRVGPAGHTLEFLMMGLTEDRLKEDWVRRGVWAISKELIDRKREPIECAALYHALDALVIYRDRVNPKPVMVKDATTEESSVPSTTADLTTKKPEATPAKVDTNAAEQKAANAKHEAEELLPVVAPRPGGGRD